MNNVVVIGLFLTFKERFLRNTVDIVCTDEAPNMDETIRQANIEIQAENRNLQALNTQLHKKYHSISLKVTESKCTCICI